MKKWPIKIQLFIVASAPALVVLVTLLFFFYSLFENMYKENDTRSREVISSLVPSYMQISNKPINYLHTIYSDKLKAQSERWRTFLDTVPDVFSADLNAAKKHITHSSDSTDVYLIGMDGIVFNTSYAPDSGMNLFSYGTMHRSIYQQVMQKNNFWVFSPVREQNTGRFRLYSFLPDAKRRFMIELGAYTPEVDEVVQYVQRSTEKIVSVYPEIHEVGILYGDDIISYLNKVNKKPNQHDMQGFQEVIATQGTTVINNDHFEHHYIYLHKQELSQLAESVLVLTYDKRVYQTHLERLFKRSVFVVLVVIVLVFALVWLNAKWLVKPISNLINIVREIQAGNWSARAKIDGNTEIRFLAGQVNTMAQQIQESYQQLEQKVALRTETIRQKTQELEEQKHELEQQNANLNEAFQHIGHQKQDIMAGIRAAERLQRIILPKETDLFHLLNAAFIVNLPKDYVSGDFYWAAEIDGKAIVALGDCTGHGVSGAILSILGNEIFNKAVKAKSLTEPDQILTAVDEGMKSMLNHKSNLHYKDGMDLAVCVIDKATMKVDYAVANSRMYFARKKEIQELKGDKNSIGDDYIARSSQKFHKYSLELQKGDMLYLTSDGFADQFGGERNKKFTRKKLRTLLSSMSSKPITLQKLMVVSQFEEWKGSNFQVDDVLMIGIRM